MKSKSFVTKDEILDSANSVPRLIKVPSVLVGYFADWIQQVAEMKVKKHLSIPPLNVSSSIKPK
jgi:hypothetical protein